MSGEDEGGKSCDDRKQKREQHGDRAGRQKLEEEQQQRPAEEQEQQPFSLVSRGEKEEQRHHHDGEDEQQEHSSSRGIPPPPRAVLLEEENEEEDSSRPAATGAGGGTIEEEARPPRKKYKKSPDAPKRFKSAFIFFSVAKHKELRAAAARKNKTTTRNNSTPPPLLPGGEQEEGGGEKRESGDNSDEEKYQAINSAQIVADAWRNMSKEEREVWEEMARKDKLRYDIERQMYTGPWKIPTSNKRKPKDPTAPKRPVSAFFAFSNSRRLAVKRQNPTASNGEISKMLSKMWQEAPEELKQQYVDEETKRRAEYKVASDEWRRQEAERKEIEQQRRAKQAFKVMELQQQQQRLANQTISNSSSSDEEEKSSVTRRQLKKATKRQQHTSGGNDGRADGRFPKIKKAKKGNYPAEEENNSMSRSVGKAPPSSSSSPSSLGGRARMSSKTRAHPRRAGDLAGTLQEQEERTSNEALRPPPGGSPEPFFGGALSSPQQGFLLQQEQLAAARRLGVIPPRPPGFLFLGGMEAGAPTAAGSSFPSGCAGLSSSLDEDYIRSLYLRGRGSLLPQIQPSQQTVPPLSSSSYYPTTMSEQAAILLEQQRLQELSAIGRMRGAQEHHANSTSLLSLLPEYQDAVLRGVSHGTSSLTHPSSGTPGGFGPSFLAAAGMMGGGADSVLGRGAGGGEGGDQSEQMINQLGLFSGSRLTSNPPPGLSGLLRPPLRAGQAVPLAEDSSSSSLSSRNRAAVTGNTEGMTQAERIELLRLGGMMARGDGSENNNGK